MATLVCFHAHPDDEAIATGGLMASAAAAGHRVVLVCATRGEQGEPQPGVLDDGEELGDRRMIELAEACRLLGADEPRWLGYRDSGMIGEPTNDDPTCFWQADVAEATGRLAEILIEVDATVLTVYDEHGNYGHPDHIQVHRVGLAAAGRVGVEHVYEATINRERARAMFAEHATEAVVGGDDVGEEPDLDPDTFGTTEEAIAFGLDVAAHAELKRAAMRAHRSQIGPDDFFLALNDDIFVAAFGVEWFNLPGQPSTEGPTMVSVLPGLE